MEFPVVGTILLNAVRSGPLLCGEALADDARGISCPILASLVIASIAAKSTVFSLYGARQETITSAVTLRTTVHSEHMPATVTSAG